MRTAKGLFRGVVMLLALMILLAATAFAENDEFTFVLNTAGDGYVVTGYTGGDANVKVPDWYKQMPVTEIGKSAFQGNTAITSVALPSTITRIGEAAFKNCTRLSSMTSYSAAAEPPAVDIVLGDADNNGETDIYDALLVMQYDAGWSVAINIGNADMDANNTINLEDALLILQQGAKQ
ncbi:MAG: hypothetical protein E7318_00065 [Clostridiales bacterium]|nr:hypothetical protein [Clostridiales bacterium]